MLPRVMGGLFRKTVGSQHHGPVGLSLLFEELTRCSLFNYFPQPHKLIYPLIWPHVTPTFKIVHRPGWFEVGASCGRCNVRVRVTFVVRPRPQKFGVWRIYRRFSGLPNMPEKYTRLAPSPCSQKPTERCAILAVRPR